jgi:xylan 1,4-beta-xylosidase
VPPRPAPYPLPHVWEHTVGSGHAPLALRADWQAQLRQCREELGFQHVRFHGLLSDAMGTLICQNEELLYSFFNADQVMDFLLSIGMRPFVELSFMPETLASGHETVFRYRGNITPPRDYGQWAELIRRLVQHWVERYGLAEVRQWYFEVWNEPNLHHFWTKDQAEYFELYRHTARAIKGIDGGLRVGGPATAQNEWIGALLEFGQRAEVPVDFVTTHYYPTDAFGEIGADSDTQLAHAPRDVMRQKAQVARSQAGDCPLYYTEWNVSSNPRHAVHDQPFAAAYLIHIVLSVADLVQGYSFWTFTDIFEENYFPSQPFHGGFGLLNLHGIPKPAYRAFELLHRLGNDRFEVEGEHETVEAWVSRRGEMLQVLLVNHAQPRRPIHTELVHVALHSAPPVQAAYVERVDEAHANPRAAWEAMGAPGYLSPWEVHQLQAASALRKEPLPVRLEDGVLHVEVDLPPYAVAAVTLECTTEPGTANRG